MTRRRPATTLWLGIWCGGLVLACRALLWLGADTLSIPLSPRELPVWAAETPPAEMAMAVLRAAGLAACAHLLTVTVAGVIARLLRRRALAELIDRVTPALARRLVVGGSSAGLAVGALVASVPLPEGPAPSTAVAAGAASPTAGARATMVRDPGAAGGAGATMTRLAGATTEPVGHDAGRSPATATMTGAGVPVGAPQSPAPPATAAPDRPPGGATPPRLPALDAATWKVAPGDSLWAIAEDVVRSDVPSPGDREVTAYWRRLVAANRAELIDPRNPDLLVPGQVLAVPPSRST